MSRVPTCLGLSGAVRGPDPIGSNTYRTRSCLNMPVMFFIDENSRCLMQWTELRTFLASCLPGFKHYTFIDEGLKEVRFHIRPIKSCVTLGSGCVPPLLCLWCNRSGLWQYLSSCCLKTRSHTQSRIS